MKKLLAEWIDKQVYVTLRATMPTPLQGVLLELDESGIMLDMPKGRSFVPVTSILHVSLLNES